MSVCQRAKKSCIWGMPLSGLLLGLAATAVQAQTCYTDSMPETTPTTQYVIHGDGTVTDTTTALMWKQCPEGKSGITCATGSAQLYSWQTALQLVSGINSGGGYAGYADWRLPTISELVSIVEEQCTAPSINATAFPNVANKLFWTSSPDTRNDTGSWGVDFNFGATGSFVRTDTLHVRLVRSIQ